MINGFEEQTHQLSDEEKSLVPIFVRGLQTKIGKDKAITAGKMIKALPDHNLSGPRVRKIINYIRNSCLVPGLIATSSGYYVTNDPDELFSYIQSLKHREAAIRSIREKTETYLCTL
jgi:hypothetical protein